MESINTQLGRSPFQSILPWTWDHEKFIMVDECFRCNCFRVNLTVSAAVKFIPRPPALVLNKNTKMSDRVWKSATMSRRSEILDEPSSRMYVCFLCHMYSCKEKISRSEESLWWLINLTSCKLDLTE